MEKINQENNHNRQLLIESQQSSIQQLITWYNESFQNQVQVLKDNGQGSADRPEYLKEIIEILQVERTTGNNNFNQLMESTNKGLEGIADCLKFYLSIEPLHNRQSISISTSMSQPSLMSNSASDKDSQQSILQPSLPPSTSESFSSDDSANTKLKAITQASLPPSELNNSADDNKELKAITQTSLTPSEPNSSAEDNTVLKTLLPPPPSDKKPTEIEGTSRIDICKRRSKSTGIRTQKIAQKRTDTTLNDTGQNPKRRRTGKESTTKDEDSTNTDESSSSNKEESVNSSE